MANILSNILTNYYEAAAVILFGLGISMLMLNRNLIKKLIGLNVMDVSIFLYFTAKGYVTGREAPILSPGQTDPALYINPVPTGLMLTGIVVSVCTTAFALALIIRLYQRYQTLNIDEIILYHRKEQ